MRVPFKRQLQYIKNNIYLYSPAQKVAVSDNIVKYPLDLVTIAFNNEIVIDYQIKLIRKYFSDDYQYTVVDNSSDESRQKRIETICVENGVNYLLPPQNPFYGQLGSPSHGITLN